jgi:hypothetical protein
MNKHPVSTAPAAPAESRAGEVRPDETLVASLLMLLLALLGRAALPRCLMLLRRALGPLGRPRARAATPAQHRRALRDLRALRPVHALPPRLNPFRPSRRARRRAAECWRMLIAPPRRHATHPRPASARRPSATAPRPFRQPPHARAGPPALHPGLPGAAHPHALFVTK